MRHTHLSLTVSWTSSTTFLQTLVVQMSSFCMSLKSKRAYMVKADTDVGNGPARQEIYPPANEADLLYWPLLSTSTRGLSSVEEECKVKMNAQQWSAI